MAIRSGCQSLARVNSAEREGTNLGRMKADDLALLHVPGRPAVAPDGTVLVALATPDLEANRSRGLLRRLVPGRPAESFTLGPRDSAPVLSPDGATVVFLRGGESGLSQLYSMPTGGGEPRPLTQHPLGAGVPVFSADGSRIAYLAPVPQAGRYGLDPDVAAEAEAPRSIDRTNYRSDGKGFTLDKPDQLFLLDLEAGAEPRQLTDGPTVVSGPAFLSDGRLIYARTTTPDLPRCELIVLDERSGMPGSVLDGVVGNVTQLVAHGDSVYYLGAEFDGFDMAGRTTGLWSRSTPDGVVRRLTDEDVEVDGTSAPVPIGAMVLISVLDRGSGILCAVAQNAVRSALPDLTAVLVGEHVVTSFTARPMTDGSSVVAAVVADPSTPGEVVTVEIADDGTVLRPERRLTDFAAELRATGLSQQVPLTATAPDGYPVHGFLMLPPGPGPHPVLLVIHGGPHAAYGWGLFDEAQVYSAAGYAVVLPNPRGSSGYGHEHGRAVLGRLGTIDADDVLALLDAALGRADCDPNRVGMMGGSYGGFLTSWLAAKAPERFTAAISERAVNAWDSFAGSSDIGYFFAELYAGAERESQWRASPLAYADDIRVPLLIIHSEHDWRCPIEQAQRLFVALKRRDAEVEMLLFPGEGHELSRSGRPRHRLQRFEAILGWWTRHLTVAADR